jgi:aconitate hydratase
MEMEVTSSDGSVKRVPVHCHIDTLEEVEYFRNGGILHYVLRQLAA